jgi:hypothetical protein
MNLVPSSVTQLIGRQSLLAQQNAPQILFAAGVAGTVASTVLACRATLKLSDVLTETQMNLDVAKSIESPEYSDSMRRKDTALIYGRSVGKVARLYAPSVILGAASIGALTKSHNILQERNLALTAAYAAVDKAFAQYRERVIDKYGEEEDREFRFPSEEFDIVDEESGKTETVKLLSDAHEESMYARFFDHENRNWNWADEINLFFLRCQQNWANDKLKARGHLFLNEVYDSLGLSRTAAGAVVGWVLNNEDGSDNYVDFNIFDQFGNWQSGINGRKGSILLDFNVDGVIWNKIDKEHQTPWRS